MKNITIFGWHGNKNTGDDAYTAAFKLLFPNYNLKFVNSLKNPEDIIILGGGDILNTYFLNELKKYPDIKKYAMSVDTNTVNKDLDLSIFEHIISRNLGDNYLPDFTFVLSPNVENGKKLVEKLFKEQNAEKYSKVVIVVLNHYLMPKDGGLCRDYITFEKICLDLSNIFDNTNASFMFLPFGNGFPHNDRIPNSYLYSKCKYWRKNALVFQEFSVQETLDICSAVDVVVSSRLHSSIFSCIGGTPFINLCHHDKIKLFAETVGLKDCNIDYWHFEYQKFKDLLNKFITEDCSLKILEVAKNNRKILLEAPLQTLFS